MKAGALALLGVACSASVEAPSPVTPTGGAPTPTIPSFRGAVPANLLLISIDTFRRDRAGAFAPGTMPFLEQLMNEGFTLENHMTCANWTMMAMACSVNGRLNEENGFIPEHLDLRAPLPAGPTLASELHRPSLLVSGNFWFAEEWNTSQGFDSVVRLNGTAEQIVGLAMAAPQAITGPEGGWFVHAHVMEPHSPYNPPDEYLSAEAELDPIPWDLSNSEQGYAAGDTWPDLAPDEQALLKAHFEVRYEAELAWLDDQLERIWADLDARHLLDDTLVVLFDDHGEQLFDHGQESHAYALYGAENDGFVTFWSKNVEAGHWTGPTSQIDLAPTLLQLYGEAIPAEMTGIPLGEAPETRPVFALTSARLGTIQSVRQSGWKLVYPWRTGKLELYDLVADPGETENVFTRRDPLARSLWGELLPHVLLAEPIVLDDIPTWPPGFPRR